MSSQERVNRFGANSTTRTKEVVGLNCTCLQMSSTSRLKNKTKHRFWLKTKKTNRTFQGRVHISADKSERSEICSWGLEHVWIFSIAHFQVWCLCLQFVLTLENALKKFLSACRVTIPDTFNISCVFISYLSHKNLTEQICFSFDHEYTCLIQTCVKSSVTGWCFTCLFHSDLCLWLHWSGMRLYRAAETSSMDLDKWIGAAAFTVLLNKVVWQKARETFIYISVDTTLLLQKMTCCMDSWSRADSAIFCVWVALCCTIDCECSFP